MNLILVTVLIGNLTVTSYRSVRNQTDTTPYHTSTNAQVEPGGVAVSRDLLCGACRRLHHRCAHPEYEKKLHYGDWLYIERYGFRFINDVMNDTSTKRVKGRVYKHLLRNRIDIWVRSYKEEKQINVKKLLVYKIKIGD